MAHPIFPKMSILWIEEQHEEYDPLFEDLEDMVGQDQVVVARTEEDGRAQLLGRTFDLLLLDLMLPLNEEELRLNLIHLEGGIRILRDLRQNLNWATPSNCNVIVLTARGNQGALEEVDNLLSSHGSRIAKPTPTENIVEKAKCLLEEAGHRNAN